MYLSVIDSYVMKSIAKVLFLLGFFSCYSQTGLSVSPPRVYYELAQGQSGAEKILITNVSENNELEVGISLGDWEYNEIGENMMYPADSLATSCAGWISVARENSYFTLKPQESREVEVFLTVPDQVNTTIPAYTAMLFVTQMNPVDDIDSRGQAIRVNIRSGIKVYHRLPQSREWKIEIQNMKFNKEAKHIELYFENNGNVWADGTIYIDLMNTESGEKIKLDHIVFYSMPTNKRTLYIRLPEGLKTGKYVATVMMDYGDPDNMEAAELGFTYE